MYNELSKFNKNLKNKWTGKTELLASIPFEKPRRLIQPKISHSAWNTVGHLRQAQNGWVCISLCQTSLFIQWNFMPIAKALFPKVSHVPGWYLQSKTSDPTTSLLNTAMAWLTYKFFVTVHLLLCTSWSYVQSALCTSQDEEQKMQFSHQLPQSPQWNLPAYFSTSKTSVEDAHITPIWVLSTVAL